MSKTGRWTDPKNIKPSPPSPRPLLAGTGGMRRYVCPGCKQKTGVKIVYGYPGEEMRQQAERKEIALGGCCEPIGAPQRECLVCEHQWRVIRRDPLKSE
jgi:hypothetical protein